MFTPTLLHPRNRAIREECVRDCLWHLLRRKCGSDAGVPCSASISSGQLRRSVGGDLAFFQCQQVSFKPVTAVLIEKVEQQQRGVNVIRVVHPTGPPGCFGCAMQAVVVGGEKLMALQKGR